MKGRRKKLLMLIALLAILISFCIDPVYPDEILLQHITTIFGIGILVYGLIKNNFSDTAFSLFAVYLVFHIIGARWNYSNTPYNEWIKTVSGFNFNEYFGFTRNHYDRLVHYLFGLLMLVPVSEIYTEWFKMPKKLSVHAAFLFVIAASTVYELLEWMVAVFMSPEAAEAYNGQQGDFWDAQKDMALAMLGAAVTIVIIRVKRAITKD